MRAYLLIAFAVIALAGCNQTPLNSDGAENKPAIAPLLGSKNQTLQEKRSIQNMEYNLTESQADRIIHETFKKSRLDHVKMERRTVKYLKEKFKHHSIQYTDETEVYLVQVDGDISWPFPGTEKDANGDPKEIHGTSAVVSVSPDTGRIISASMTSKVNE